MNVVPSLNTLNEAILTDIAKKWGAETGEKVLIVRNEGIFLHRWTRLQGVETQRLSGWCELSNKLKVTTSIWVK
jgi:hypothetical protein